jgi:quercetin dioxygenase-like cupin family protein
MASQTTIASPYSLAPDAGKELVWFGSRIVQKASSPEIGITEGTLRPGEEPPVHVHSREDEWLYVLDGEMSFQVGVEEYRGSAGAFVSFPRNIAHTFTIESESARFLVINTPGGFERMFELAPKTPEDAARAMEAFGMTILAPHPRDTAAV